jgi:hypothetical protein
MRIMKNISIASVSIIVLLLCCSSGCLTGTSPQMTPTQTVPTQVPETLVMTTQPPVISLSPGPTQTIPSDYYVEVEVTKQNEAGRPVVTVTYRGGKGLVFTQQVNVRVTRSDGIIETGSMNKPSIGDERQLEATIDNDRVEVSILFSDGKSYKVFDRLMPYQSVNP